MIKIRNIIIIYIVLISLFISSMLLAYSINSSSIKIHVNSSISQFSKEGMHPLVNLGFKKTTLDNFTDMLMLNMAVSRSDGSYLKQSLNNVLEQEPPTVSGTDIDQLQSLKKAISGNDDNITSYARYWHGYQIFLKPSLTILNYNQLRIINIMIFYLVLMFTLFVMYKKLGLMVSIIFAYSLLMVDIIVVPLSIQFSSIFYIMLFSIIFILKIGYKSYFSKILAYLFFVIGCLTSFFDLLTSPLLTLGIPLTIVLILMNKKHIRKITNDYVILIENTIFWGMGYGITWTTKWIIASYVLKRDVIHDALNTLLFRVGLTGKISPIVTLYRNIVSMINIPNILVILMLIFLLLKFKSSNKQFKKCMPIFIMGIYPYIWFFILKNHSYEHFSFTYRIQAVSLFSFSYCILCCIDLDRIKRYFKKHSIFIHKS